MAPLECTATQLRTGQRLSGLMMLMTAMVGLGGDGSDGIGPPCTLLTSLSERERLGVKQQSETEVNHFIYSLFSPSPPPTHLSLPFSLSFL